MIAWSLRIIARKKPVTTLALGLAIVTMVTTTVIQSATIIESSAKLAEKLIPKREKLIVKKDCTEPCIKQCTIKIKTGNKTLETTLTIIPESTSLKGLSKQIEDTSIGTLLSEETGINRGQTITIQTPGGNHTLTITNKHYTHSPLDLGLITKRNIPGCNQTLLTVGEEGFEVYAQAFSRQVQELLAKWSLASTLVLGLGSLIASIKAYMDLAPEWETLHQEGAGRSLLPVTLSIYYALAVFVGYAWGQIVTDLLNDVVATFTNLYIPRSPVEVPSLVRQGLAPAFLAGLITFLYGATIGLRNRINHA